MGNVLQRIHDWWYEVPIVLVERPNKICFVCRKKIDEHMVREYRFGHSLYWCSFECFNKTNNTTE